VTLRHHRWSQSSREIRLMRASRCLAKSLSARAELPILSCNGMHVIVF
jgi:hypothetical protein